MLPMMIQLGSFLSPRLSGVESLPPPSPGAGGEERCHIHFIRMLGWLVDSRCIKAHLHIYD